MADNHKGDDGHGGDHGGGHGDHGGDHGDHGGGDKHGKASGGGGGSGVAKVLRNPVTWAVAGVGALLVAVFASGVQMPSVDTGPSPTYDVSESPDAADGQPPGARRSTAGRRYSARTCANMVQRARNDFGRDWESELSPKVRADCGRTIQEARRADRNEPRQAERPRPRVTGPGDVEVQRMDVAYGDLDLTTSAGAERFLQRLERAAVQVCGGRPDLRDLEARRAFKDCVQRNMDNAVAQLRAPRVTELHRRSAG